MIKKYNQYIKENNIVYSSDEIDPYGEENWDDEDLTPILRIAKRQGLPYDQITELFCHGNDLTNLNGIENLVNLEYLTCSYNNLINLKGLENLVNLELLRCSFNNLTTLKGIENLRNLKELSCYNNNLTNLDGIGNLSKLKELWCFENNFSDDYKQHLIKYCKNKNIDLYL